MQQLLTTIATTTVQQVQLLLYNKCNNYCTTSATTTVQQVQQLLCNKCNYYCITSAATTVQQVQQLLTTIATTTVQQVQLCRNTHCHFFASFTNYVMHSVVKSCSCWVCHVMIRGGCLELHYCNTVEWSWWDSSLIWKTNWFPSVLGHCFLSAP